MAEIFYPTNPADDCLAQWDCDKCGERLAVFTWSAGQDVECPTCGLLYNAAGQRVTMSLADLAMAEGEDFYGGDW